MSLSKEIQEQIRNQVTDMFQSVKVYKAISEALGFSEKLLFTNGEN